MPKILQVAIPAPLHQCFDYLFPESLLATPLQPGMLLKVPFGRREQVGVLLEVTSHSSFPLERLKPIHSIIDEEPLPLSLLQLCRFASDYYRYPIGEVLSSILPPLIRQGKKIPFKIDTELYPTTQTALQLNSQQQQAVDEITHLQTYETILLSGVTGSGKTEVYLRCIEALIQQGKQVLILIPEIGLTPQTLARFRERFNVPIAVLHSSLSDKKRTQAWIMAKKGIAKIIIGTRSAIFVPLLKPGMIILDEEHDPSFKQQSHLRYSARDLAVVRGRLENIPVVLGSATPSLESLHNVQRHRYRLITLPYRAGEALFPILRVFDLRKKKLTAGIGDDLLHSIRTQLEKGNQVLLFLNRRGYAPVLLCHGCGYTIHCEHCDARLTLHHQPKRLYCHHCGASKAIPSFCPQCQQCELIDVGLGTEKLEMALQEYFPHYPIVRIDRDSTRTKNSMENKLSLIHNQKASILIGTQMIAKGHHFPHLTLVIIVDADSGLYSTDFRALERMGQLLLQVAGRAGRVKQQGEVFIQTHHSDHPFLTTLLKEGYEAFAQQLLQERQISCLPPYTHNALLRAEARTQPAAHDFLLAAKEHLAQTIDKAVEVLGPIPATMERKAGRYRYQLLLQSENRAHLQRMLHKLMLYLTSQRTTVRWFIDVDPQEII